VLAWRLSKTLKMDFWWIARVGGQFTRQEFSELLKTTAFRSVLMERGGGEKTSSWN
jgi:hypothetical protein